MSKWIDITVPLKKGMVHWPQDPSFNLVKFQDMERGDHNNISILTMGSHTGTHLDAPAHFIRKGKTLDLVSLDSLLGPARIIHIKDSRAVTSSELKKHNVKKGERVIFKTRNSAVNWPAGKFNKGFIYLADEAAAYLAKKKVKLVGIDYLSVGQYAKGLIAHKLLLSSGIPLLEGVLLHGVKPGNYELICLPLRVEKGDGCPVRSIIKRK